MKKIFFKHVNFIIDFYLPPSDMSKNSAHWGFGSGPMDVLTFDEDSFHIGINSNGIDDVDIDDLDLLHNAHQLDALRVPHRPHSILPGQAFSV